MRFLPVPALVLLSALACAAPAMAAVPTAPTDSAFGSPACATARTADERTRCEATQELRGRARSGSADARGGADDTLAGQWERAVENSRGLRAGDVIGNRLAALLLGAGAFALAVRVQLARRRRSRAAG